MNYKKEHVLQAIKDMLKKRLEFEINNLDSEVLNEKLLGPKIGLSARELVYLLIDIEREFGITLPEEAIASGKFDTFDNICNMIISQLELKEKNDIYIREVV